jgi:hypothetical protein
MRGQGFNEQNSALSLRVSQVIIITFDDYVLNMRNNT